MSDAAITNHPTGATGAIGDFNFLNGEWKIRNRRLKARWTSTPEWEEFEGAATCWSVLGGMASIEELRIPAHTFRGMGIRLLDLETKLWSDYWVSATNGRLMLPAAVGDFKDGAGVFTCEDVDEGRPILARGIWDRITPDGMRWWQTFSCDGGLTWEDNWFMEWTRA